MNPCEDCHRPVGVHCCHNCKKDANKCKEYHGCGSCNAWEQGIFTNADRIRAMSDEELAKWLLEVMNHKVACFGEGAFEYTPCRNVEHDCVKCGVAWLKQPVGDE